MLAVLRWLLFINGLIALLGASVAYRHVRGVLLAPWERLNERLAHRRIAEPLLRDQRVRACWFFMGVIMLGAWWHLGTPTGRALLAGLSVPDRMQQSAGPGSAAHYTTLAAVRLAIAHAIPYVTLLGYLAFGVYTLYVSHQVGRYCDRKRPEKPHEWDPAYYGPGAEPWLARLRWIKRWDTAVWVGVLIGANALYVLIKP